MMAFLDTAGETLVNYEERKVGRVESKDSNGVGVSTCKITDHPGDTHETALLDVNGAHPVERYRSRQEAEEGHKKWIEKAKTIEKVIKLGTDGETPFGEIEDEEITLDRSMSHD